MTDKIEIDNSENQDPNLTPPPRSPTKSLNGSPTSKSMWDSGDPRRNPPPLPASPQMIRITGNKNKNNLSPNSVGKLQFATIPDNTEIEHQLERIINGQSNLRSLVVGVDTSVKQTQLDLESLVERSSNNNTHLKDLVQNVKSTLPVVGEKSNNNDKVEKLVSDALESIQAQHKKHLEHNGGIIEKLDHLKLKLEDDSQSKNEEFTKELHTNIDALTKTLELIKSYQSDQLKIVQGLESRLERGPDVNKLNLSIDSLKDTLIDSVNKIETRIQESPVAELVKEGAQRTDDLSKELKDLKFPSMDQLEKDVKDLKSDNSKIVDSLQEKIEEINKLHSVKFAEIQESQKSLNIDTTQFKEFEYSIIKKLTDNSTQSFEKLLEQIQSTHDQMSTNYKGIDTSTSFLKEAFQKSLENYDTKHNELKQHFESKSLSEKESQIQENQKLQLELKDKEISELISKLETEKSKNETQSELLDLTKQKVKVETQLEALNKAYIQRFNEFKELTSDYEEFQSKLSNLNLNKIKNIYGAAAITKLANEQPSPSKANSPRKNPLSTRVMSTNSYLNTNEGNLTPRSKKKYEFDTLDQFEEKENL
ncbi:Laminin subunit beta-4 [Wickerhamomyces ciferrii]|uniref:Laminin subunit beta-4 n=1 Tax=Wickerhamomyces ciferrii (strain ATCC 14091 / BCRC 22168 / CBS 111 / JCM 3599 / NBRC 0793 / NRRL Y-1031 F-60-10) TaxID=1206466 RepID=K0KRN2_WICCF|nr:Laminin subunit beta-4 [Wickerhamomyces ciferrii]CCH43974.1 Laminin subunit beta-4 [Wickerhamomyces ciferrii]